MNNVYDNGEMVLGTLKNVKKYILKNSEEIWETEELLQDLEDLEENTIVAVNYDNGMGYSIDWWEESYKIEV